MIRFTKGDLFATPGLDALAHGCNCAGAMGRGIALEFRRRFRAMYEEYRRLCRTGSFRLGSVFPWKGDRVTIYNLGTQADWRTKAELPAIERAVAGMLADASQNGIRRIGLPRIGAGLGGLHWDDVKVSLQRIAEATDVEVVVFEEFEPRKEV